MAEDVGVITTVLGGWVDVTMIFDVRTGQLDTPEAQVVTTTSLVLKTVVWGITVVAGLVLEEPMLDEAMELLELCTSVLLIALILFQLPLLSVYSYCIAGFALMIFTLLT